MGSSWVNNLFDGGFLGMGISRAARLLALPNTYVFNRLFYSTATCLAGAYSPLTGIYVPSFRAVPDRNAPFPYGLAVELP